MRRPKTARPVGAGEHKREEKQRRKASKQREKVSKASKQRANSERLLRVHGGAKSAHGENIPARAQTGEKIHTAGVERCPSDSKQ